MTCLFVTSSHINAARVYSGANIKRKRRL